jgi:hypothetical protein
MNFCVRCSYNVIYVSMCSNFDSDGFYIMLAGNFEFRKNRPSNNFI